MQLIITNKKYENFPRCLAPNTSELGTKMIAHFLLLMLIFALYFLSSFAKETNFKQRSRFLDDFIVQQERPAKVVSFFKFRPNEKLKFSKSFYKTDRFVGFETNRDMDNNVYLADLDEEHVVDILNQASGNGRLIAPARWILFCDVTPKEIHSNNNFSNSLLTYYNSNYTAYIQHEIKQDVENKLYSIYFSIDTEVYIAFECYNGLQLFLVYKIRPKMKLIWELYGIWNATHSFDRARPDNVVAMRRLDLQRANMVAIAVILNNNTLEDMPDYRNMEVDTVSKYSYYMSIHLFDWLNVSGSINTTTSFGYIQADGNLDGMIRELDEKRSEFCATVLFPLKDRIKIVHFVLPPIQIEVGFMFRKPSLATVANIYALPFSRGVWGAIILLIFISAMTLGVSTLWEMMTTQNQRLKMTITQRISKSFHDTFCLVFQQGTSEDPVSSSGRQILLMGLMSFMFLYTAYSANVVALLQSVTNDINSVETLLKSPLQCAAEDVIYNRKFFKSENESTQRAFWLKKVAPHGENFFLTVEEGVRRIRQGLFAFHVEKTAALYQVQKTFFEHEKCNINLIKYFSVPHPHTGVSKKSPSKEQISIGILRIIESGLQSRTNRRITGLATRCAAGTALFTPVSMLYVIPIYKYLLIVYLTAVLVFVIEVCIYRRGKQNNGKQENTPLQFQ